jgi:hypothetical protein
MKIEVTRTKRVKEEIEVEIPYYYKHDLTDYDYENTSVIYGKITENEIFTIHEKIRDNGNVIYEIEKEKRWGDGSYFAEKYKSTNGEYEEAKERAKQFFNVL